MKNNKVSILLDDLATKKSITEIMINDIDKVFVENKGENVQIKSNLSREDVDQFVAYVYKGNKKEMKDGPILDGVLPDGSRINIVKSPLVRGCPAITIRKYLRQVNRFDIEKKYFGVDQKWHLLLKSMIKSRCNIMVSGGTGVGKTTFLNSMINEVDISERIVAIEDTFELDINLPNVVRLLTKEKSLKSTTQINIAELVKSSLRMRPDRIIIGETRGGELFDLLQAMNTGHSGSMSSIHANSSRETLSRMENLFLMSGFSFETKVVRGQIANTIDYIIHLSRDKKKNRVIESIMEITGIEGMNILAQVIVVSDDGVLRSTGLVPEKIHRLIDEGSLTKNFFE